MLNVLTSLNVNICFNVAVISIITYIRDFNRPYTAGNVSNLNADAESTCVQQLDKNFD